MTRIFTVYRMNWNVLRLIAASVGDDDDYREATARQSFPFIGCAAYPLKVLRNLGLMGTASPLMSLIRIFIPIIGEAFPGLRQGLRHDPCLRVIGH